MSNVAQESTLWSILVKLYEMHADKGPTNDLHTEEVAVALESAPVFTALEPAARGLHIRNMGTGVLEANVNEAGWIRLERNNEKNGSLRLDNHVITSLRLRTATPVGTTASVQYTRRIES